MCKKKKKKSIFQDWLLKFEMFFFLIDSHGLKIIQFETDYVHANNH